MLLALAQTRPLWAFGGVNQQMGFVSVSATLTIYDREKEAEAGGRKKKEGR